MDRPTVAWLFQSLPVVLSEAVSRLYSSVTQVQLNIIAIPVGVVLFPIQSKQVCGRAFC